MSISPIQPCITGNIEFHKSVIPFRTRRALSIPDEVRTYKIALLSEKLYSEEPKETRWDRVKLKLGYRYWVTLKVHDSGRKSEGYVKASGRSLCKNLHLNAKQVISRLGDSNLTGITQTFLKNQNIILETKGIRLRQFSSGDLSYLCDEEQEGYSTRETSKIY